MISNLAHISPTAKIGENVKIHPFVAIDDDVEIGDGCEIFPFVSIVRGTRIERNNKIYSGAILGADPQDFRWKGCRSFCYIGDNNVIREQVIINRGITSEGSTRIGNDSFFMAGCHIGHDCQIAGKSVFGNGVKVAGDVKIGMNTILSSNAIVHESSVVGDWVLVKGGCRISNNVPPYTIMGHNPAVYLGTNAYILRGNGLSNDEIDNIAKAYRHIYQSGSSVYNAIKRIEADVEDTPYRQEILDFIYKVNFKIIAVPEIE